MFNQLKHHNRLPQTTRNRGQKRCRPSVEQLQCRLMMAGDVVVDWNNGDVTLEGTNEVDLAEQVEKKVVFSGHSSTGEPRSLEMISSSLIVESLPYEGTSPVTAMIPYGNGILTAFTSAGSLGNRVHWSPDGNDLGGQRQHRGHIRYEGVSEVTAMIPYQGGVLTAFSNVAGDRSRHRIHWSPDGLDLGGQAQHADKVVYEGVSPVTAMIPYNGGILAAFSNVSGDPGLHRIHWSPGLAQIGSGPIRYEGSSPVSALTAFRGGILAAFTDAGSQGNRIHWSPDGMSLGQGPLRYEGTSPVVAMNPYGTGILTAFRQSGPSGHRVHWSPDGNDLGGQAEHRGKIEYDGTSPVKAMISFNGGVLTAFTNAGPRGNRIHWSPKGKDLGMLPPQTFDIHVKGFGSSAQLNYEVTGSNAGPFRVVFYVSKDDRFDSSDPKLPVVELLVSEPSKLALGDHSMNLNSIIGDQLANPELPHILVKLEPTVTRTETDSLNNVAAFEGLTVAPSRSLVLRGGSRNDTIKIDAVGGQLEIEMNGVLHSVRQQSIDRIVALGLAGRDRIQCSPDVVVSVHLNGGLGNDILVGGSSNDTLIGGGGGDVLNGRNGNDLLIGDGTDDQGSRDIIYGHNGDDEILGGDGNDRLVGMAGDDLIRGGNGNDAILGRDGDDVLYGAEGRDIILGARGNDMLFGNSGNDRIKGGSGNDELHGGLGADKLWGHVGEDVFVMDRDAIQDYLYGGAGFDRATGDHEDIDVYVSVEGGRP